MANEPMSNTKTIAVFVVIVGCFAVLYPKIFHPIVLNMFGMGSERNIDDIVSKVPPHLRGAGPGRPYDDGSRVRSEFSPHMRGPHPGLRAAAEMKKQATTTTGPGGGKGMMAVVLPMYAIGIVLYLIYTLTKVFGKKDDTEEDKDYLDNNPFAKVKQQRNVDGSVENYEQKKQQPRKNDLEKLLSKADDRSLNDKEMRLLKARLLDTEKQMTRILKAMELVNSQVPAPAATEPIPEEQDEQPETQPKRPTLSDLSPDMDSYEFVNNRGSSSATSPEELLRKKTFAQKKAKAAKLRKRAGERVSGTIPNSESFEEIGSVELRRPRYSHDADDEDDEDYVEPDHNRQEALKLKKGKVKKQNDVLHKDRSKKSISIKPNNVVEEEEDCSKSEDNMNEDQGDQTDIRIREEQEEEQAESSDDVVEDGEGDEEEDLFVDEDEMIADIETSEDEHEPPAQTHPDLRKRKPRKDF